jgi:hypothetical protein
LFDQSAPPRDTTRENPATVFTFALERNFPNPVSDRTWIRFSLDRPAHVALRLYDLYGREAAVITDGERKEGYYQQEFRPAGLPSGVYFYQLRADNRTLTRSLIIRK